MNLFVSTNTYLLTIYRNLDEIFQITTRNSICHPLRANRGGGRVIGVLEMINKLGNEDFDSTDIDIMADCARRVSDELHIRFRELLKAAELLEGKCELVGERKAHKNYDAPTKASVAGQYGRDVRTEINPVDTLNAPMRFSSM